MTTTPEPETQGSEPVGTMEIRRTVGALIVSAATAQTATWTSTTENRDPTPLDVRIVVTAVDTSGREHHLSLSPETAAALLSALTVAHLEALRQYEALS